MDPAGAGVAWPGRGGPGDGRRDLSSPSSVEPPYKKVRNNAFQSYPSQEDDGQGGFASGGQGYRGPPFNPGYGVQQQQQMQMPSNGFADLSGPNYNTPPSGFPPGSAKGTGALFLKTKLCTKFKLGTCTFDDRCHFAHGIEDLRKPPVGWETMVANAGQGGPGGIRSNDGLPERKKSSKPCRFFADGKECPYGDRCTFVQASSDKRQLRLEVWCSLEGNASQQSLCSFCRLLYSLSTLPLPGIVLWISFSTSGALHHCQYVAIAAADSEAEACSLSSWIWSS